MTIYSVDMNEPKEIDFAPVTLAAEVAQNIRTILSTPLGTVPLARHIGLNYEAIDEPAQVAQARLIGDVMTAIQEQEPRATITEVLFPGGASDSLAGRLSVIVRFVLTDQIEGENSG